MKFWMKVEKWVILWISVDGIGSHVMELRAFLATSQNENIFPCYGKEDAVREHVPAQVKWQLVMTSENQGQAWIVADWQQLFHKSIRIAGYAFHSPEILDQNLRYAMFTISKWKWMQWTTSFVKEQEQGP